MSASVARQVAVAGTAVVITALVVVGLGTGAALHAWRVRALDDALLAAAHGHAHPPTDDWDVEHSQAPVDVWLVNANDHRVPEALVRQTLADERPRFADVGSERLALLVVEREERGRERHLLVAAAAPRVTLARSVGAFAAAYGVLASLAAVLAAWVLTVQVRRAFAPLERARAEVARVVALGQGQRVDAEAPEEVAALLVGVNDLLERLDAAFQAQGRFTAEAAHELRTPVTAMLGELDVALRHPRDAEALREVLVSTREEADRLRQLVDGLTTLARLDAGHVDRHRELVRAGEVVAAAIRVERPALDAAHCPLTVQALDDPELEAHRPLLEAALGNLLRNAARHAPGAPVSLTVRVQGDHAVFEVDDGGAGLDAEARQAVFDRFARTGQARRRDRAGLGLGLPLAREVALRHGGDCTLHDAPGGGLRARLTVRLPGPPTPRSAP